jgi:hypothetical protein
MTDSPTARLNTSNYTGGARGPDLTASVAVPAALGADGVILWGSSAGADFRALGPHPPVNSSCVLCRNIQDYVTATAGPLMAECVAERRKCAAALCSGNGRCASTLAAHAAAGVCKRWAGVSSCVCSTGWAGKDCATSTNGTNNNPKSRL